VEICAAPPRTSDEKVAPVFGSRRAAIKVLERPSYIRLDETVLRYIEPEAKTGFGRHASKQGLEACRMKPFKRNALQGRPGRIFQVKNFWQDRLAFQEFNR
jgi:hypothetical protein